MSSCIKIRLKNIPNVSTNLLDIDGYYYLDLEVDADMSFTKQLTELTELDTMPFDYALSIDVPATPKNNFILGKYLHKITAADRLIPCEVLNGSQIYQINLTVTQINSTSISLDLLMNDRLWAKKLADAKLRDLQGDWMYRYDYLKQLLPAIYPPIPYIYQGTGVHARDVYYPVVDYGDLKNVTNSKLISNVKLKLKQISGKESSVVDSCFSVLGGFPTGIEAFHNMALGIVYLNFNEFEYTSISFQGVVQYSSYAGKEIILNTPTSAGNYTITVVSLSGTTNVTYSTFGAYKSVLNYIGDTLNGTDFRPWHFAYPLLKRMFCNIGYDLESPILESNYGRRILTYILDPELSETNLIDHVVQLTPDVKAIGGAINSDSTVLMTFQKLGIYDLKISVGIDIGILSKPEDLEGYVDIFVWVMQGDKKVRHIASNSITVPKASDDDPRHSLYYVELTGNDVVLKDGQRVEVLAVKSTNLGNVYAWRTVPDSILAEDAETTICGSVITTTKKTEITATNKHRFFWREFDVQEAFGKLRSNAVIDKSITQLDYLKAITHLLNLKFYTNHAAKKVLALQPDEVDLYGEVLEGFYQPTDIELELIDGTYQINPDPSKVKYHHIKFKGSDLHGHKVIVNNGLSDGETITSENILFTPTYLQQYGKEAVDVTGIGKLWRIPRTPLMLFPNTVEIDEDEKETAFSRGYAQSVNYEFEVNKPKVMEINQAPMVMLNYGRRYQNTKEALVYGGDNGTLYPIQMLPVAAHYHPSLSEVEGVKPISGAGYIPTGKTLLFKFNQVGYDWLREYSLNLTEILHYKSIVAKYNSIKMEYLGWLTNYVFQSRTLREIYTIQHLGKPYKVTLDAISDFKICQHIPTIVNMTSLEPVDVYCDIISKEEDDQTVDPRSTDQCDLENIPDISISYDVADDVVTVVLSGLNTDPVVNVLFESSEDMVTWTTLTNISTISATFISAGVPVYIRASVEYEDCPLTVTTPLFFSACDAVDYNNFDAEIYVKPDGEVCTKAVITIDEDIPYTVVSFTIDIGAGAVAYTAETEICDVTEDVVYTLTTEVNNCPQVTRQIVVPYEVRCPNAGDLGLEIEEGIRFIRTGNVPLGMTFDRIYYQGSDDGENWGLDWLLWVKDYNVIYPYVRARRIIEFCDVCPDICTPIIYWEDTPL